MLDDQGQGEWRWAAEIGWDGGQGKNWKYEGDSSIGNLTHALMDERTLRSNGNDWAGRAAWNVVNE
jgi:hypothetical protein